MFKTSLTICLILISFLGKTQTSNSETELKRIEATLMNYIDGTSYSRIDQITKAFYPDANLYLDNKQKELWVVPISQYLGFFKGPKEGKRNGRIGRILSIDYFGNIAHAKVEILIPKASLQFMDMFILKEINGEWKIISKTANSKPSNHKGDKILCVVSNAHYYGDSDLKTGNSFGEITAFYEEINKSGYAVDFVSPKGGAIPLGYINTSDSLSKHYLYDGDFMYALKHTMQPSDINPDDYQAIYYVGGGSLMNDVPDNTEIQKLAMHIYEENNGVISSVCHGVAGIVNLKTKNGDYLINNKIINGYPDAFENRDGKHYKEYPFNIQQKLEEHGGIFKHGKKNEAHVEVSGNLITGQNYLSAKMVAMKIVEQLGNQK